MSISLNCHSFTFSLSSMDKTLEPLLARHQNKESIENEKDKISKKIDSDNRPLQWVVKKQIISLTSRESTKSIRMHGTQGISQLLIKATLIEKSSTLKIRIY